MRTAFALTLRFLQFRPKTHLEAGLPCLRLGWGKASRATPVAAEPAQFWRIEMHSHGHLESIAPGNAMASPAERRSGQVVREHFEEGCALLAPFFDPARQWSKLPLDHLALRALRERFRDLTSTELIVMMSGIRNLHASRRTPTPFSRP